MCSTCGCGAATVSVDGIPHHHHDHDHDHDHGHAHDHAHPHDHGHDHPHDRAHPHGTGAAAMPGRTIIQVEKDILAHNNHQAERNRARLAAKGILALNLVSSPGSGKTTLLVRTIGELGPATPVAVIEGDQLTDRDAQRVRQTGATAIQVNTGKGCHLDAAMVDHAIDHLQPLDRSLLFIENVGNLVCPAEFDLGEAQRVVLLAVTEGDEKPLKYAPMFAGADLLLINKIDLLPYVDFDVAQCIANARQVRPDLQVLCVSATTGEGMAEWCGWLQARRGGMPTMGS
jgi:hydrogenase nickel incorporation protein HypB